jgi:hypothetical protein
MDQQRSHENGYEGLPSRSLYPELDLLPNYAWVGQEQFVGDDYQTYENGRGNTGEHFAQHDSINTHPCQSRETEDLSKPIRSGDLGAVAPKDQGSARTSTVRQFRIPEGEVDGDNASTHNGESLL